MKNTSSTKTELRVKSPLVSVIIPVFNVEEYLEECINSCEFSFQVQGFGATL